MDSMIAMEGQSIVLERGASTLSAQDVVIDRYVSGSDQSAIPGSVGVSGGQLGGTSIVLIGTESFNVARGDLFTLSGIVYEVVFAHPADAYQRVAYAAARQP